MTDPLQLLDDAMNPAKRDKYATPKTYPAFAPGAFDLTLEAQMEADPEEAKRKAKAAYLLNAQAEAESKKQLLQLKGGPSVGEALAGSAIGLIPLLFGKALGGKYAGAYGALAGGKASQGYFNEKELENDRKRQAYAEQANAYASGSQEIQKQLAEAAGIQQKNRFQIEREQIKSEDAWARMGVAQGRADARAARSLGAPTDDMREFAALEKMRAENPEMASRFEAVIGKKGASADAVAPDLQAGQAAELIKLGVPEPEAKAAAVSWKAIAAIRQNKAVGNREERNRITESQQVANRKLKMESEGILPGTGAMKVGGEFYHTNVPLETRQALSGYNQILKYNIPDLAQTMGDPNASQDEVVQKMSTLINRMNALPDGFGKALVERELTILKNRLPEITDLKDDNLLNGLRRVGAAKLMGQDMYRALNNFRQEMTSAYKNNLQKVGKYMAGAEYDPMTAQEFGIPLRPAVDRDGQPILRNGKPVYRAADNSAEYRAWIEKTARGEVEKEALKQQDISQMVLERMNEIMAGGQ